MDAITWFLLSWATVAFIIYLAAQSWNHEANRMQLVNDGEEPDAVEDTSVNQECRETSRPIRHDSDKVSNRRQIIDHRTSTSEPPEEPPESSTKVREKHKQQPEPIALPLPAAPLPLETTAEPADNKSLSQSNQSINASATQNADENQDDNTDAESRKTVIDTTRITPPRPTELEKAMETAIMASSGDLMIETILVNNNDPESPGVRTPIASPVESFEWLNNVVAWLCRCYRNSPDVVSSGLHSLNVAAKKVANGIGCEVVFEELILSDNDVDIPKFSSIRSEPGAAEHLPFLWLETLRAAVACSAINLRLVSSQKLPDCLLVSNYDAKLTGLSGEVRFRLACIANELFLTVSFVDQPSCRVELSPHQGVVNEAGSVDVRLVEEAIRQSLGSVVTNICLAPSAKLPEPVEEIFRKINAGPTGAAKIPPLNSATSGRSQDSGGRRDSNRLLVKVLRAQRIGAGLVVNQPFATIEMDDPPQKHTTSLGLNLSPHWDEQFIFDLLESSEELLFEVYDKVLDAGPPRFYGLAIVGIEELRCASTMTHTLTLQPRPYRKDDVSGTLTVEFMFLADETTLVEADAQMKLRQTESLLSLTQAQRKEQLQEYTAVGGPKEPTRAKKVPSPEEQTINGPKSADPDEEALADEASMQDEENADDYPLPKIIKSVSEYFQVPAGMESGTDPRELGPPIVAYAEAVVDQHIGAKSQPTPPSRRRSGGSRPPPPPRDSPPEPPGPPIHNDPPQNLENETSVDNQQLAPANNANASVTPQSVRRRKQQELDDQTNDEDNQVILSPAMRNGKVKARILPLSGEGEIEVPDEVLLSGPGRSRQARGRGAMKRAISEDRPQKKHRSLSRPGKFFSDLKSRLTGKRADAEFIEPSSASASATPSSLGGRKRFSGTPSDPQLDDGFARVDNAASAHEASPDAVYASVSLTDRLSQGAVSDRRSARSVSNPPSRDQSESRKSVRWRKGGGETGSETSELSTNSLYQQSTLVVEISENNVNRYYLIPPTMISRALSKRMMRRGQKLHIFNEHTYVAVRLPRAAQCDVCERNIGRIGKQAYQCRDCLLVTHKRCHYRTDTKCPNSRVSDLQIISVASNRFCKSMS